MRTSTQAAINRRRRQSGSAMVEFALSAVLLISVFAGVFQFGYSIYLYNSLVTNVRAAARYASVRPYTSTTSTPTATYSQEVKNVAVYGTPTVTSGMTPLVRGLTTSNVGLVVTMNGSVPREITVEVVNFNVDVFFTTVTFNQKPKQVFPYNG